MKTKSILMLVAGALLSASTLTANATIVKKNPKDVKIYIDPGHGAFNGNCRPMPTVKRGNYNTSNYDTTGFFESNTNLWKAWALFNKLKEYGVTHTGSGIQSARDMSQGIMMSRVVNGVDTELAQRRQEIQKYQPDLFLSIHSNASPDGSIGGNENYPLILYRGEDYRSSAFTNTQYGQNYDYSGSGLRDSGSSYEFGKLIYSHLNTIEHEPYTTEWTKQWEGTILSPDYNVRGDVEFMYNLNKYWVAQPNSSETISENRYSSYFNANNDEVESTGSWSKRYYGYYAVMRQGAVGCLSEGYMHTYYPSVMRHMNKDVCAIEGIAYAHAIADYFGWEKEKTGYIYGIVRDRNQTFTHTYYIPNQNSDDIYKPLNNCTVYLCDKYGNRLYDETKPETAKYRYVTDDECNGAFVFYDLEPGDYTLDYECDGYQPASQGLKSTVVTVKANEISYPKAFLNANGYSMNAGTSLTEQWRQAHTSVNGFWMQGAATLDGYGNETVYTVPAIQAISDLYFISATNFPYTKGWSIRNGSVNFFSSGNGPTAAFPYGTGTYFEFGPGIAADGAGTLWTPSVIGTGALSWANGVNAVTYYTTRPQYRSSGQDEAGVKSGINLSSYKIGKSDLISAYGDGINSSGALWFCSEGKDKVICVYLYKGTVEEVIEYNAPVSDVLIRSLAVQYSETEIMYNCGRDPNQSGEPANIYKGIINKTNGTISWTNLGVTTVNSSGSEPSAGATMFRLAGNEYLVYSSSKTEFTIKNITTGETIVKSPGFTSASTYVNHNINAIVKDNNNVDLFVYVPGANGGAIKYQFSVYNSQDDPVSTPGAVGSTVAEIESNNYEPNITVTWEAPASWTEQPTNYLVQYKMYYTNEDGSKTYIYIKPDGGAEYKEEWMTAGMTEDATCKFVHEGVEFVANSSSQTVLPLNYEYRIIPNFNCYDGEVSEISATATIEFVAPKPAWNSFSIEPITETNDNGVEELKQYNATATWNGVAFESNKEFSLQGYKLELFRSEDTEKTNPVASFSFKANDSKYFGELTDNVGAMLDDNGNVIENLTYSKVVDSSTGKTVNQFNYNAYNLDVLDVNDNGTAEGKEFTAQVTAEFWIVDGSFVYGTDIMPVTCKKAYTPVAPSLKPTVYYYEKPEWGDWDVDYYGNPAKGEYDVDDAYWKVYWVNMDITKPNADAPVSSYTLTLTSNGKSDVTEVMLYDPKQSLGLPLSEEEYAEGYVALPADIAIESFSTRATVESSSATFTIPGNYDFSQAEADGKPMVTFYVKDFDTTINGGATDYDGDNSALNYTYNVAANYASGNKAIASTATGGANPVNGGITTAVENIEAVGMGNDVVVFPVPATVEVTVKAAEAIEQVVIYSASGTIVKSLQGDGECAMTIAVDDLEEGTYFIRVNNLAPAKFVKN